MTIPNLLVPADDLSLYLPKTGTWPESWYLLDGKSQDAIRLAVACGRPLLVRGLPGTGKSDLARAAAEFLERAFVYEVITARTEPQDLLWRLDAIARLADAQAQGAGNKKGDGADPGKAQHYVSPGVLWWAIDWKSAEKQLLPPCQANAQRPDRELTLFDGTTVPQQQRAQSNSCVLLLDEIDKADSELPNSLLEVLANTGFRLPWGDQEIKSQNQQKPLIIITTNEDRELPPAFVRRCLVLNIEIKSDEFSEWIKKRARVHFRDPESAEDIRNLPAIKQSLLVLAADYLEKERNSVVGESSQPGLAEFLDLLRGLQHLSPDNHDLQEQWLDRVYRFAYQKQVSTSQ